MAVEPFSGLNTSLVAAFAAAAIAKTISDVFVSRRHDRDVQTIEAKVEREPEKARFAWDLARVKLEAYFDRNLVQVNAIFWVSVSVMIVGFGLIGYGIAAALQTPNTLTPAVVGAASGVITEFIGATFMFIYRSTMQQASSFMTVLERINSVGMAVQILDSMPDSDAPLKNATRAELVKILLTGVKYPLASTPEPTGKSAQRGAGR